MIALLVVAFLPAPWLPSLTTAGAVRRLSPAEADRQERVRLIGVVTHANPHLGDFFVQDATAGIYVTPNAKWRQLGLKAGDRVEVVGVSNAGEFAPCVLASVVRLVGAGAPPDPLPYDLDRDDSRWLDGQYVQVLAVGESFHFIAGYAVLQLRSPKGTGLLMVPGPTTAEWLRGLVGAPLRIRGVCVPMFDATTRSVNGPARLFVQTPASVIKLPLPPSAGDDAAPLALDELMRFVPDPHPAGRRVKVAGVVTAAPAGGNVVYLADKRSSAMLVMREPAEVPVGERVEAVGTLTIDGRFVQLRGAVLRRLGPGPPPIAQPRAAEELTQGGACAELVRVEGVVEEVDRRAGYFAIHARDGGARFVATIDDSVTLPPLAPGMRIGLTGICLPAELSRQHPSGVVLKLRSLSDLEVLEGPPPPPWWTARRIRNVILASSALALFGAAWVVLLRAQVRRQAAEIRRRFEREADLERSLHERRRLEALGRLASGIAHDFNNLLTIITGGGDMAAAALSTDHPAGEWVATVRHAAARATDLTRQMLTFARERPLAHTTLDLRATLVEVEMLVRPAVGDLVRVTADYAADLPHVLANAGLITQIVLNLAVNARDAMPNGGELTLRAARAEAAGKPVARLTVADNGCGMDDATRARVFEPFFTTKDVGQGTGLGLSTVYGIVQDLGGTIRVESEPGRGTAVIVDLPAVSVTPASRVALPLPAPVTAAVVGTPANVLLVDDDDGVRRMCEAALMRAGFCVTAFGVPDAALEALRAAPNRFDLLLSDAAMPGTSGPKLAAALRELQPALRVMFMSGFPRDEMPQVQLLRPEDTFLQKPFTPTQLADTVRTVLEGPPAGRDQFP